MKSFFKSLFSKRLVQHPDSFALSRAALWNSIAESIRIQQSAGKSVWLVAHFLDTFSDCQTMLEQHGIDYFIETEPVGPQWFVNHGNDPGKLVHLLLADLAKPFFSATEQEVEIVAPYRIAMMVAERHPYGPKDERLIEFALSLPAKVEVGYYLAMEDELVNRLIPDHLIELLKTMGLQEQDLISSAMVTKRLRRFLRKGAKSTDIAGDAESAEQWFDLQEQSEPQERE